MKYFYIKDEQRFGPIEFEEILDLVTAGQLSIDTLVWSAGLDGWKPICDLEECALSELPIPPPVPLVKKSFHASGSQVRPWIRLFARWLDVSLYLIIFILVFYLITGYDITEIKYISLLIILSYVFVEPILLSTWGYTPGKALCMTKIKNSEGVEKLSYRKALIRSLRIWWNGLGTAIPLISLFTLIHAYDKLKKRGNTSWDETGHFLVLHKQLCKKRSFLLLMIGVLLIASVIFNVVDKAYLYNAYNQIQIEYDLYLKRYSI